MARADPARAGLTIRCAIYTRKSSDEGLEQEFNSLDAQREACEAYIVSQRCDGSLVDNVSMPLAAIVKDVVGPERLDKCNV
jgi:hypothetical protein